MAAAYLATGHGPRDGDTDPAPVTPAVIAAHHQLAGRRKPGETVVAVHGPDHPAGPALQAVTDEATMLLDTVAVLLHRLGIPYSALMAPVFPGADGRPESWIHVPLLPTADRRSLAEAVELLPMVLADARQVADDSAALATALGGLAAAMDSDDGTRFPGADRAGAAELLRWLSDGHFVLLGSLRCAIGHGTTTLDEGSRRTLSASGCRRFGTQAYRSAVPMSE